MTAPDKLIQLYGRTHGIVIQQTDGLTHEESLLQLPFRANCLNWVLGHIIVYRDSALELLGERSLLTAAEAEIYEQGADPIADGTQAMKLERLLSVLDQQQERLVTALKDIDSGPLAEIVDEKTQRTVGDRVEFLQWHETYHVGQLEILRQLAGKDDAII
jgi:uncharacterized damage-inducible protein DinB